MSVRQAGGLEKRQGRFKKDDTARKRFINTVALPSLRAGVLPSAHDEKMLFLGPMDNTALSAQDKTELEKWVSLVYKDSRARQPPSELDVKRQTTLLEWAKQNAQFCAVPRHSAGDGDHGYKVAFGTYKDSLVSARPLLQVVTTSRLLVQAAARRVLQVAVLQVAVLAAKRLQRARPAGRGLLQLGRREERM